MTDRPPDYFPLGRNHLGSGYNLLGQSNSPEDAARPSEYVLSLGFSSVKGYAHLIDVYVTSAECIECKIDTAHLFIPCERNAPKALCFASIPDTVDLADFKMVEGCRELDLLNGLLPNTGDHTQDSIRRSVHDLLIKHLSTSKHINDSIHNAYESNDSSTAQIRVLKMTMFSKETGAFSASEESNTLLLYKWAKPQSIYGQLSGPWQMSLVSVVRDGMMNAGGQLRILVREVSSEQLKELESKWEDGERVMEF